MGVLVSLPISILFAVISADAFDRRKWRVGALAVWVSVFFLVDAVLNVSGVF